MSVTLETLSGVLLYKVTFKGGAPQDLSLIVTRGPEIDHIPPPKRAPLAPGRLTHHPPTVLQNLR